MSFIADLGGLDWIFIAIVVGAAIMGLFSGLIHQIASAIGLVAGIALAQIFSNPGAQFLSRWIEDQNTARIAAYLIIFTTVIVIIRLLASLITALVETLAMKTINRGLGGLFGALKGLIITAVIAGVLHHWNSPTSDKMVMDSVIVPHYDSFYTWLDSVIGDGKVEEAGKALREKVGLGEEDKP